MDAVTTVTMASEVANSQVVWSILCIALTVYVLWTGRQERQKLMDNNSKLSDALSSQAETMKEISESLKETNDIVSSNSKSLEKLETRIDNIERNSYRSNNDGR